MMGVELNKLKDFLDKANKATYANKNAPKVEASRPKSQDYHFEDGDLIYHDTYFGSRDFIGEEIVYDNKVPVWGANYFGFILSSETGNIKEIYNFLRTALMQDYDSTIPVRGPSEFSSGHWRYNFSAKGSLTNFTGEELILFKGKVVYKLYIHGGLIH